MIEAPYPELSELLVLIGEAGRRMSDIEATEGAAGNISLYLGWQLDPRRIFPNVETIPLPDAIPELAGKAFLITGSGRRLREIIDNPAGNLGYLVVDEGGETGQLHTSPGRLFERLTSEFNSHLSVHRDQVRLTGTNFHAVLHAQPPHLTYLSHIPRYRDERVSEPAHPALGAGDDRQPARRHRRRPVQAARLARADGGHGAVAANASHRPVGKARRDGALGRLGQARVRPDRICGDRRPLRVHEPGKPGDGRGADGRRDPHDLPRRSTCSRRSSEINEQKQDRASPGLTRRCAVLSLFPQNRASSAPG